MIRARRGPAFSGFVARKVSMRKSDSFRYADRTWNADFQSTLPSSASWNSIWTRRETSWVVWDCSTVS